MIRSFFVACCCLVLTAGAYAATNTTADATISDKLLQAFKQTFPDAREVKWVEQADKYTVNFKQGDILTKVEYDRDGNFLNSLRYYSEKNLPVNILCRLQRKYADKTVFGVTEMTSDSSVEYYIKMEDDKYWVTVRSDTEGNMRVTEKYRKAE
ncbi:MAG TPA: hypothetical protein VHE54_16295 [Puia sp.]|nr:hypothetical protein [Puia sp.]